MKLAQATTIAERIRAELQPHTRRCEVAGSIRRRKAEVGDIEIVCIPRLEPVDLFGTELKACKGFIGAVNRYEKVKGEPTGKYTQRILPGGIKLDLFIAHEDNWGLIFAIRTGSARFSHERLAKRWVQLKYKSVDGMLMREGKAVPVREEENLFRVLGIRWVEAEAREL